MTQQLLPSDEIRELAASELSPLDLLKQACESNADIQQLEKLIDLYERWDEREAGKAFVVAAGDFQTKCPRITKTKTVSFGQGTEYSYAPLDQLAEQIAPVLAECGLAYRWQINDTEEGGLSVTCIVTHTGGHSERASMSAGPDTSGKKNAVQARASTVTYLQRYTLIGVLGITSADADLDARLYPNPTEGDNKGRPAGRGERVDAPTLGILTDKWKARYPKREDTTDEHYLEVFCDWARSISGRPAPFDPTDCHEWTKADADKCFAELEGKEK